MATSDGQRKWIREHVPGRSFADIGGMYQLMGDDGVPRRGRRRKRGDAVRRGRPRSHRRRPPRVGLVRAEEGRARLEGALRPGRPRGSGVGAPSRRRTTSSTTPASCTTRRTRSSSSRTCGRSHASSALIATITIPEVPGFDQACVFYPVPRRADGAHLRTGVPDGRRIARRSVLPFDDRPHVRVRQLLVGHHTVRARRHAARRRASRSSAVRGARSSVLHGAGGTAAADGPVAATAVVLPPSAVTRSRAARDGCRTTPGTRHPLRRRDAVE